MSAIRPLLRYQNARSRLRQPRGLASSVEPLRNSPQAPPPGDDHVRIVEVGPRDGLQNEKKAIPQHTKIELISRLARTGLTDIEAGSFVAPRWVPQMAGSDSILQHILTSPPQSPGPINFSFLAPNARGLKNAQEVLKLHTLDASNRNTIEISVFAAASESFSQKNLNCDIATSLERFKEVIQGAKAHDLRVRGYISVVLGCPFEGRDISPQRVAEIATNLLEMGVDEISLGDTTGMGTGPSTRSLLKAMHAAGIQNEDIACHFHDTYGQALVNTAVSLEHGIRIFDSSVGGLGGCPYSPGATGNVATEDMVYFIDSLGMKTGIDLPALAEIGEWISGEIDRSNASNVGKAILGSRRRRAGESKL
ncbi:hydroxymethylglutaryl-CoA lyase [Calycina marina]|uniref:hydroxymethylglutaryl-CoA lyase n=1 Tax=Calycina marina TaxID=1763456 RepID=A0A9P8CD07_9HELO|nr:hydroxymethylglutaryl-CoA lyase [Calycina marina]